MDFIIFLSCLVAVLVMGIALMLKEDPWGFKKLINDKIEGSKIKAGWWLFLGLFIILAALSLLLPEKAQADTDSPLWFAYGKIEAGVDIPGDNYSQFCKQKHNKLRNRITSDGRIMVNVVTYRRFEANVGFLHHSCAYGPDASDYNSWTISFGWYIWNRR